MSAVEEEVKRLNKLRAERKTVQSGMDQLSYGYGKKLGVKVRGLVWKDPKIAPLPDGIETEFLFFLREKREKLDSQIRELEKYLESISAAAGLGNSQRDN